MSTGKALALLLVLGGIAAVAWQAGRASERKARSEAAGAPTPAAEIDVPGALPAPAESAPAQEAEAVFELPVPEAEERSTAVPDAPPAAADVPAEERPADTPARCLMLQAYPSNVSAFGTSGEVVQLVVRAQNGCGTNFGYVSFRAAAIGLDGRELASAVGSFAGGVLAGGSAETLIAVRTKPATSLTYRAEVR